MNFPHVSVRREPWRLMLVAVLVLWFGREAAATDPLEILYKPSLGAASVANELRRMLEQPGTLTVHQNQIRDFYQARGMKTLWLKDDRPNSLVRVLFDRILDTVETGLTETDMPAFDGFLPQANARARAAAYELRMTELFLRFAKVLLQGRYSPKEVDPDWHIALEKFDAAKLLGQLAAAPDSLTSLLDGLEPQHQEYRVLLGLYKEYKNRGRGRELPSIEMGEGTLKPGMSAAWIPALRARLQVEFFPGEAFENESDVYDPLLVDLVKRFQAAQGVKADGVLGPKTKAFFSTSVEDPFKSIRATLERWRWMPRNFGQRYIIVNIPSYELYLYENAREIWQTKVVVGSRERPSPSVGSSISHLKVNPKWHVPESIALKDLIPKQMKNKNYLYSAGYRVLDRQTKEEIDPEDIDWQHYSESGDFPYLIRQESGDRNALGRLKFEMPNRHAIYLHDTPSRALFDKTDRAYSSGCIRVDAPYNLAGMLLDRDNPTSGKSEIEREIREGETRDLELSEKVRVFLTYFTTWVDSSGKVTFKPDIYGRNKRFPDD